MLMKSIANVLTRIRTDGWKLTARKVVHAMAPSTFEVWQCTAVQRRIPTSPNIKLFVGNDAMEVLRSMRRNSPNLPIEFYRDTIDGVESCAVAIADSRLASVVWAYDGQHNSRFVRLGASEREIRGLYCIPEYRGQAIGAALTRSICDFIFVLGTTRIYAVIHSRNFASLHTFRRVGFEKVVELTRAAIFGDWYLANESRVLGVREQLEKRLHLEA